MYMAPCWPMYVECTSSAGISNRSPCLIVDGLFGLWIEDVEVATQDVVSVVGGMGVRIVHGGRAVLPLINLTEACTTHSTTGQRLIT